MNFHWEKWIPEPGIGSQISTKERRLIKKVNDSIRCRSEFVKMWRLWWWFYPESCVLATRTTRSNPSLKDQHLRRLRFWFGSPLNFEQWRVRNARPAKNLIVSVTGAGKRLDTLCQQMLPQEHFVRSNHSKTDIPVWHRKR